VAGRNRGKRERAVALGIRGLRGALEAHFRVADVFLGDGVEDAPDDFARGGDVGGGADEGGSGGEEGRQ
jgi:hypothetical protein